MRPRFIYGLWVTSAAVTWKWTKPILAEKPAEPKIDTKTEELKNINEKQKSCVIVVGTTGKIFYLLCYHPCFDIIFL